MPVHYDLLIIHNVFVNILPPIRVLETPIKMGLQQYNTH